MSGGWILALSLYGVGVLISWRLISVRVYRYHRYEWSTLPWTPGDSAFALLWPILVAPIWPLGLPLAYLLASPVKDKDGSSSIVTRGLAWIADRTVLRGAK